MTVESTLFLPKDVCFRLNMQLKPLRYYARFLLGFLTIFIRVGVFVNFYFYFLDFSLDQLRLG